MSVFRLLFRQYFKRRVFIPTAPPAPISGALGVTLDAVTISSAGVVQIKGDSSVTLAAITISSAGAVQIKGDSSVTLDAVTLAAAGAGQKLGAVAVTLDAVTLSSAGAVQIKGTLSVTLGAVTVSASNTALTWSWLLEAYISAAWVDISDDVMLREGSLTATRGIEGKSVTSRVAAPGSLTCVLDNGESNSAGLIGYYSFNHANMRANFTRETKLRLKFVVNGVTYIKWRGYLDDLDPLPNRFGARTSYLTSYDFMQKLVDHKLSGIPVQENQRPDQLVDTILDNVPTAPASTSLAVDPLNLPLALHSEQDEKSTAMSALQKVCQTALGYAWVEDDEVFVYQREAARATQASSFTLDNTMSEIKLDTNRDKIKNKVVGSIFPSRVDTDQGTLLASLSSEFAIDAGDTLTIKLRMRDPNGGATRISGKDFVTPLVAGTHYKMSAYADSGLEDMNDYLTPTLTVGGNTVSVQVQNTGSVRGYISQMDVYGNGIYLYDPIDITVTSGAGDKTLTYDLYYLSDYQKGKDFITAVHKRVSTEHPELESVMYYADFSLAMMQNAMLYDIGDRITLREFVTGLDTDFTINWIQFTITRQHTLKVEYKGEWASEVYTFFTLDDATYGTLDTVTNVLSPY